MSAAKTEELPQIGEGLCNAYHVKAVTGIHGEDMPSGGFVGMLAKSDPVGKLKEVLCQRLGVPFDGLSFACEGRHLEDGKTMGENGVLEPGPAARRAGAKINITFMMGDGIELGAVLQRRAAQQEEEAQREAERKASEQAAREAAANRAREEAEAKAKADAEAMAQAEQRARDAAREADRCVVRCAPLGMGEGPDAGAQVRTFRSSTISELAQQISEQMGMRGTAGQLTLTFNGEILMGRTTLREANIADGATILYYWEGGD